MRRRRVAALTIAACALGVPQLWAEPTKLGLEFQANAYSTASQRAAKACMRTDGSFVVTWSDNAGGYLQDPDGRDGSGSGVVARGFDSSGNPAGAGFVVNSYTTGDQVLGDVVCTSSGEFVVAWRSQTSYSSYPPVEAPEGAFARRFASDGAPQGAEFRVSDDGGQYSSPPRVTGIDACRQSDGGFVLLSTTPTSYLSHTGRRYDSAGQQLGSEFAVGNASAYGDPSCCAHSSGFVVAWSGVPSPYVYGNSADVFAQRFGTDASAIGTEFQVNTYTSATQRNPEVGCNPGGEFVVVWETGNYGYGGQSQDGDQVGIGAQRYDSTGQPAGSEFIANPTTSSGQAEPAVFVDGGGNFFIAWTFGGGVSDRSIRGAAYDSAGQLLGTEVAVSTQNIDLQERPAVAGRSGGGFIVAWDATELGADSEDVLVQRFDLGGSVPTTTTTLPTSGVCGDPLDPSAISIPTASARAVTASDALFVLRAAVGLETCELCVCDVDGSGGVSATDALIVLSVAVGQPIPLDCPPCS